MGTTVNRNLRISFSRAIIRSSASMSLNAFISFLYTG